MVILHTLRRRYVLWSHVIRAVFEGLYKPKNMNASPQEVLVQVAEDSFVAAICKAFETRKQEVQGQIADKETEIERLTSAIEGIAALEIKTSELLQTGGKHQADRVRRYGELRALKALLKECTPPFETALRMQYHELLQIPRVASFWIEGMQFMFETHPLYGDYWRQWHRIGPFIGCFDIVHPDIKTFGWKNLSGAKGDHQGPPNIITSIDGWGRLNCPGPAGFAFIRGARSNRDYTTLVSFAVRYPECSGQEGNAVIEKWPVVEASEVPQWYIDQFRT